MLVLVDLEETLIESWQEPFFLPGRIALVRDFLQQHPEAELGLMSWAVYHDQDMGVFQRTLQADLERLLERPFSPRWTLHLDQWGQELFDCTRKRLPREELFDVFGKADTLLALARHHPEWVQREVVLFDDAFDDMALEIPGRGTKARIVNVKQPRPSLGVTKPRVG